MNHTRSSFFTTLRLLTLAAVCATSAVYADDYGDVSQMLRAGKLNEAMVKVDSYLAAKPTDPQMRFLKGVIQRSQGKQAEAIATFTKLTDDYPELPEPYNNLAVLYAGQSQFDKARVALEMAIRTNPSYATAHENLGDVYARLASQAYNKALQLDGANVAVPPKLALIRELFGPNNKGQRPATASQIAAASVAAAKPTAPSLPKASAPAATARPTAAASQPVSAPVKPNGDGNGNSSSEAKAVEAAVQAWAKAWAAKDMSAYLRAYSKEFVPSTKQTHAAWEADRRKRIVGKSGITLKLENLRVTVSGDSATARFRQNYRADALSVSSRKTLELTKTGDRWLITRESTGN